jgi:hypothetical protein
MKNILCIIATTALLCGCAGMNGQISSTKDRFTGKTINQTSRNDLSMGLADSSAMTLNMRQEIDEQGRSQYFLVLSSFSLEGTALIPNPPGDSLFIIADSNRFSFASSVHQGDTFLFSANKDQLLSIAYATNVEVRVVQISGLPFEKKFNSNNRNIFKCFADKFLQ